jgi:AcrR family transcriptional regulator
MRVIERQPPSGAGSPSGGARHGDSRHGGLRLAEPYDPSRPGLPRGRSSLPAPVVRKAQRERLLGAVISAVAEHGYPRTTVAMVVARARVSRKAFYDHFSDLENCFLTALADAQKVIVRELMNAPKGLGRRPPARAVLQSGLRSYLTLCAREPEYARCILVELPAVGPRALKGRNKAYRAVADVLRLWREHAAKRHPEWPPVEDPASLAAVGAIAELITAHVCAGDAEQLPDLHGPLTEILLRILAAPLPADS